MNGNRELMNEWFNKGGNGNRLNLRRKDVKKKTIKSMKPTNDRWIAHFNQEARSVDAMEEVKTRDLIPTKRVKRRGGNMNGDKTIPETKSLMNLLLEQRLHELELHQALMYLNLELQRNFGLDCKMDYDLEEEQQSIGTKLERIYTFREVAAT